MKRSLKTSLLAFVVVGSLLLSACVTRLPAAPGYVTMDFPEEGYPHHSRTFQPPAVSIPNPK